MSWSFKGKVKTWHLISTHNNMAQLVLFWRNSFSITTCALPTSNSQASISIAFCLTHWEYLPCKSSSSFGTFSFLVSMTHFLRLRFPQDITFWSPRMTVLSSSIPWRRVFLKGVASAYPVCPSLTSGLMVSEATAPGTLPAPTLAHTTALLQEHTHTSPQFLCSSPLLLKCWLT